MLDERILASQITIKVDGNKLSTEEFEKLVELMVDSNQHLPDMCNLTFHDDTIALTDGSTFTVGKSLEVSVMDGEGTTYPLFKGEIATLETEFTAAYTPLLIIRGYDKSHRLHRGKKNRTFLNMSDSDIVKQVAGDVGLSPNVDTTSTTHEYVLQYSQTDWEFIRDRARRNGYHVYMDDGTLHFKKAAPPSGSPVDLEWGENLSSFNPRIAATHQVNKVTVKGWDFKKQQAIVEAATSASDKSHQGGETQDGGALAKKAFSDAETIEVHLPLATIDEAKAIAQAIFDRNNSSFVTAEGVCIDTPQLKAGSVINVTGVGSRFGGKYILTTATHSFRPEGGFETHFTVQGQQEDVLSYLLEKGKGVGDGLLGGVVPAVVTNNDDQEQMGRVKVKYPWLDDQLESDWLRLVSLGAGAERGNLTIPEVNDEVLVAFERGRLDAAYVIGGLWNGDANKLPKGLGTILQSGKVNERIIRSRTGHLILLDDTEGAEQIVIQDKTGNNEIVINSAENSITINVDKDYSLNAKGKAVSISDKETEITSKGNMTIKADQGSNIEMQGTKITIKGQSAVAIEASGNMDLKANGMLNLKGAKVSIQADGMAELKSSGILQIQGSLVKIN